MEKIQQKDEVCQSVALRFFFCESCFKHPSHHSYPDWYHDTCIWNPLAIFGVYAPKCTYIKANLAFTICSPRKFNNPWNTEDVFHSVMSALAQWQAEETFPPGPDAEDVVSPTWSTKVRWGQFPFFRGLGPILHKKVSASRKASSDTLSFDDHWTTPTLSTLLRQKTSQPWQFCCLKLWAAYFKVMLSVILPPIYACSWTSVMLNSSAFCCRQLFLAWCHDRADSEFIW